MTLQSPTTFSSSHQNHQNFQPDLAVWEEIYIFKLRFSGLALIMGLPLVP